MLNCKGTKLDHREKNPKFTIRDHLSPAVIFSVVLKLSLDLVTPFSSTDLRTALSSYPLTRRFTIAVDSESPRRGDPWPRWRAMKNQTVVTYAIF